MAQLLYLSAGITRQRKYSWRRNIFLRCRLYRSALRGRALSGLRLTSPTFKAGVYHFAPAEFGLRRLRAGDYRSVLVEATGGELPIAHAPLTIVCTCTYWRNAWKYQARTYRHFGWDNGTLLANLLAVATALGLPAKSSVRLCGRNGERIARCRFPTRGGILAGRLGHGSRAFYCRQLRRKCLLSALKLFRSPEARWIIR